MSEMTERMTLVSAMQLSIYGIHLMQTKACWHRPATVFRHRQRIRFRQMRQRNIIMTVRLRIEDCGATWHARKTELIHGESRRQRSDAL